ncbi:MAG: Asd/ArgC dimerization domain-containing protein [Thermoanaerobaculia bacterium]
MTAPKHKSGYRLGIVNPITLVGNEIKSILRERSFPSDKVVLLDSTGAETGALTEIGDEPAVVTAVSDDELEELDLVFFAGPPAGNREWIDHAAEDRFLVIDVSQPSTIEGGRVAVAGVNLEEIGESDRLLVSPHPVAIPIALVIHHIARLGTIDAVAATVVQPASELDQAGVEELARQTISVMNVQSVPKEVFDRQVAFNLYPAPERNEEFIVRQIREITHTNAVLALLVTQGTIFHSHTFSLFVKTEQPVDADRLRQQMRSDSAFGFPEGDQEFGTIDAAGRDEVLIAEIRPDASTGNGFWVWAVCDNLRRSSALNAVLIAEKVLFGGGATN